MGAVKTYDPKSVDIIVGTFPVSGFADGTFISVERDNPSFNSIVGSDGEGARALSNDKSGTVTITLLQTSATNDFLSGLVLADENLGKGVVPLLIKDRAGRTLIAAETCWVEKPASYEGAREISNREWVLKTNELKMFIGGT